MREERVVHCWEDGPEVGRLLEGYPIRSTCMLLDGHEGPHDFVPDDQIVMRFA